MSLLAFLVVGLLVGLIARAITPAAERMSFLMTTGLGIIGSLVGGIISALIFSRAAWLSVNPTSIVYSILGAVVVLGLMTVSGRWTHTRA